MLKRLVRRIRRNLLKQKTTFVQREEWEKCRLRYSERDADIVADIAESAHCDWLLDKYGEARFFEFN